MLKYLGVYSAISVLLVNCANLRPTLNPANNNLFKFNNRSTSRKIEISLKLIISFKINKHRSDVYMLTFNILHNFTTPSFFIVNSGLVNIRWKVVAKNTQNHWFIEFLVNLITCFSNIIWSQITYM